MMRQTPLNFVECTATDFRFSNVFYEAVVGVIHWADVRRLLIGLAFVWMVAGPNPDKTVAADDATRPNILFCIADDWSYGHATAYGCKWVQTPNFDAVAKRGLLFHRAYTPNAKCAPSRASILTGRNSWQLEEACGHVCPFPPKFKTYPEALSENGYFVGMTGKGWGPGYARTIDGKNRQIAGKPFQAEKAKPPARQISNNDYAGNFRKFLDEAPQNKPWCFWYGTTEPHRGYQWRVGIEQAEKKLTDIDRVPPFWPDTEEVRTDLLDYAFEVEHFDNHLGQILRAVEKAGQLENTIVIVTSDHGMPFPRCKGQAYDYSNHVPLAISWPARIRNPGRIVNDYVSFVDLVPTFLQAAELTTKSAGMHASPGQSLFDIFESDKIFESGKAGQFNPRRDHVLIGKERHDIGRPDDAGYPIRGIVMDDRLYLRNFAPERWPAGNPETGYLNCDASPTKTLILNRRRQSGSDPFWELCFGKRPQEEFYDLAEDDVCLDNLANADERQKEIATMRGKMIRSLLKQNDPRMIGQGDFFERIPYVNKSQQDFYNRFMRGEKLNAGWVLPTDFEDPAEFVQGGPKQGGLKQDAGGDDDPLRKDQP